MDNKIVEILKLKELEMDQLIEDARDKARILLDNAEQKYKEAQDNIESKIVQMTDKLIFDEESAINIELENLRKENHKKIIRLNELYELNKSKAVDYTLNRLQEELLDQEDDKTSDHRAKIPAG